MWELGPCVGPAAPIAAAPAERGVLAESSSDAEGVARAEAAGTASAMVAAMQTATKAMRNRTPGRLRRNLDLTIVSVADTTGALAGAGI